MKLRFTPRATEDLRAIADYIREVNPAASLRVRSAILGSLQHLVLFPEMGRRSHPPPILGISTISLSGLSWAW